MASIDDIEARADLMDRRLRQVLTLLAHAPVENTTIRDPNGQGDFVGRDRFISPDLRDEARDLLNAWDEEDGPGDDANLIAPRDGAGARP